MKIKCLLISLKSIFVLIPSVVMSSAFASEGLGINQINTFLSKRSAEGCFLNELKGLNGIFLTYTNYNELLLIDTANTGSCDFVSTTVHCVPVPITKELEKKLVDQCSKLSKQGKTKIPQGLNWLRGTEVVQNILIKFQSDQLPLDKDIIIGRNLATIQNKPDSYGVTRTRLINKSGDTTELLIHRDFFETISPDELGDLLDSNNIQLKDVAWVGAGGWVALKNRDIWSSQSGVVGKHVEFRVFQQRIMHFHSKVSIENLKQINLKDIYSHLILKKLGTKFQAGLLKKHKIYLDPETYIMEWPP